MGHHQRRSEAAADSNHECHCYLRQDADRGPDGTDPSFEAADSEGPADSGQGFPFLNTICEPRNWLGSNSDWTHAAAAWVSAILNGGSGENDQSRDIFVMFSAWVRNLATPARKLVTSSRYAARYSAPFSGSCACTSRHVRSSSHWHRHRVKSLAPLPARRHCYQPRCQRRAKLIDASSMAAAGKRLVHWNWLRHSQLSRFLHLARHRLRKCHRRRLRICISGRVVRCGAVRGREADLDVAVATVEVDPPVVTGVRDAGVRSDQRRTGLNPGPPRVKRSRDQRGVEWARARSVVTKQAWPPPDSANWPPPRPSRDLRRFPASHDKRIFS
jgi:hypothetical protein